ncbi:MAG: glutamate racemase [Cytophagaceae bacterium]
MTFTSKQPGPIGVFDSGYGGLTILKELQKELPEYDYLYLGDNARAPYGNRSYETVYQYTLECVKHLFEMGCHLIILACNTASAKALRTIQQNDLNKIDPNRRVLGVIRPVTEIIENFTKTKHIGILGTKGTIESNSYPIEISKFFPHIKVYQEACPMWVPLVENNEFNNVGADYYIKKNTENLLRQSSKIDTVILGCTHYPLLIEKISRALPSGITIVSQGEIVAKSLKDYLTHHPEIDAMCSKNGQSNFLTTDSTDNFNEKASIFLGKTIKSSHLNL